MSEALRYSPLAIHAYSPVYDGVVCGPAGSSFLMGDPEAWNLAFLSHPYEDMVDHPDPKFTTHVRRTLQFVIKTGKLDIATLAEDRDCVRHWLRLPAPQAAERLRGQAALSRGFLKSTLPLFEAYGQDWLDTIARRSWLCQPQEPDDGIVDLSAAASFLEKFRK